MIKTRQTIIASLLTLTLLIVITALFVQFFTSNNFNQNNIIDSVNNIVSQNSDFKINSEFEQVTIVRIIDGDTIVDDKDRKIRLIGINTPELNNNDINYCFAVKSKNVVSSLVLDKSIKLEKDVSDIDKYGRLLRYVWFDDKMLNKILLEEGYAQVSTYAPDVKYQEMFLDTQKKAKNNKVGLWGDGCE